MLEFEDELPVHDRAILSSTLRNEFEDVSSLLQATNHLEALGEAMAF